MATLGVATVFAALPPRVGSLGMPWAGILVYGLLANVCYSLGPIVDILLRTGLGERAAPIGQVLFRYGFVFSVGLTLLPILLAAIGWVLRLLF